MSYLLVGILFLLIAAAFVTFLVLKATKRSSPASRGGQADQSRRKEAPFAADSSPAGDSAEHAGEQSSGRTVTPTDADQAGGTGRPTGGIDSVEEKPPLEPHPEGRFQRDPIGGEAEARPYTERG